MSSSLVAPPKSQQGKPAEELSALSASCERRLEQTATPLNDFFSAQFLVPFAAAGAHQLAIETRLVDGEERRWRSSDAAAAVLINIKVFEDGQGRGAASAASAAAPPRR